ncbi:uncharacterized protein EI90DRAFT_3136256 [Cantharellus anzutake]|uniref:uncharacterized protein n=1 Tax=Cantharellus anzutake TaxID=1750568 RepID=UPI001903CA47|nr:uncharacterized protein EI90DRAFT_3136256 [Cantharellus anzutake]KAF8314141.1 hypothetical protein EI90DRAFT_3136256 [Cantharellus anzutake]
MALTGRGRPPRPPRADYLAARFDAFERAMESKLHAIRAIRLDQGHPHPVSPLPKSDSLVVCLEAHFFLFPLILRGQRWFIQPSPNRVYTGSTALQPFLSASSRSASRFNKC